MWSTAQIIVLKKFCELAQCRAAADHLLQHGALCYDDIAISILPVANQETAIRILIKMGTPSDTNNAAIYKRLLELNLLMPQINKEKLSLDPLSGDVIFSYELQVPTAEALMNSLRHLTSQAKQWQQDYFLDDVIA